MKLNSRQRKKRALFDKFNNNLEHIKKLLGINFQDDGKSYICPLCFKLFNREGLNQIYDDQLTLEHSPPESLGGRIVALTAQNLNSESGHSLDSNLKNFIALKDFKTGSGSLTTKFKINKQINIKGEISKSDPQFWFKPSSMHRGAKKAIELMKEGEFNIDFKLPNFSRPDVGLLRTAYLIAFGEVGYSLLFGGTKFINQGMVKVREQLNNPQQKIIKNIPILQEDFPSEFIGVNIVYEPKEFRSIFVTFDLSLNSRYRFGVFLPGPDNYGFSAFDELRKFDKKRINLKLHKIRENLDLNTYEDSIEYFKVWEALNGWTK